MWYILFSFVGDNENPDQDPYVNLPAAAATYAIGGMATHWTACTPEEHRDIEHSKLIGDNEWTFLYNEAKMRIKTTQEMFDDTKPGSGVKNVITPANNFIKPHEQSFFIRNTIVLEHLKATYPNLTDEEAMPQYLPLAGERRKEAPEFITWSGTDTVLDDEIIKSLEKEESKLELKVMSRHHYSYVD